MRSATADLLFGLFLPALSLAKDDEESHENWMQEIAPVDVGDLKIEFSGVHAQETLIQVKLKIVNGGEDYFYFQPSEPEFDLGGTRLRPNDGDEKKPKVIKPRAKVSHSVRIKADSGYHVDGFGLKVAGFSKASSDGKVHPAEDFQVPAARNNFDAGPFACSLDSSKLTTGVSTLKFTCRYKGNDVGWVDSREMGIRAPNGQEFANADKGAGKELLGPGDSVTFTGLFKAERKQADGFDMQFDKFEILWRNTFSESKLQPLPPVEVQFKLDEALTQEKNE